MKEQTDYVGNMIYENNALKRILVDGGYIEDGAYYFYETFTTATQSLKNVSVTVSRSLAAPVNATRLPAFNFFLNGTRRSFFNSFNK